MALSRLGLAALVAMAFSTVGENPGHSFDPAGAYAAPFTPSVEPFREMAGATGLDFVHFNGMSGEHYMPEMVGPGAALFDFDNDGDLDIYITQGHMLGPGKTLDDASVKPRGPLPLRDRLFRNDLVVDAKGRRRLKFTDVTDDAKLDVRGYGMGVAAGDVNNDGWVDLYVTNFGNNNLLLNNGDGTFRDAPGRLAEDRGKWSTSAAFVDFDRDGWLDLFVCDYVQFNFALHKLCYTRSGEKNYCGPNAFNPEVDQLLRNRGDGAFVDVSLRTHVGTRRGPALGVVCTDFNGDGWIDIYVANDGKANHYWVNQGNGRFAEDALLSGCAFSRDGLAEASMGIDAGDFDGDGDEDLFMTHLNGEKNTLYENDGTGLFTDVSAHRGLDAPSRGFTAFGTAGFDYDNDGWLDLLVANGEVRIIEALARKGDRFPMDQPNQLFRNLGGAEFVAVNAGEALELAEVSRGAAFGDIDNDGDTDVLILNNNGPARLLVNQVGQDHHWLGLRLVGTDGKRDMLGARVEVTRLRKPALWRRARSDASYCSANDPRVLVGLGDHPQVEAVRVYWPDGTSEAFTGLVIDTYTTLRQGSGKPFRLAGE